MQNIQNSLSKRFFRSPLRNLSVSIVFSLLFMVALNAMFATSMRASPRQQNDGSAIAYISSSTENQSIRLINPDGTNDHLLWQVPQTTAPHDGIGFGGLSWHPDSTELAFDSGHDWERSLHIRDLYAVSADGQSLRRISRSPSPDAYDQFPEGDVHFTLEMLELGDVQLYVEGMKEPVEYFARADETWTFTMTNVADFGDDFRQYMRIVEYGGGRFTCNFNNVFAWVDVVPNTFTRVGSINLHPFVTAHTCPRLSNPVWTHDGSSLYYVFREADTAYSRQNLWHIEHTPPVATVGTQLFNLDDYIFRGKIYRAVAGPTAETANEILFLEDQIGVDVIIYTTLSDPTDHRSVDLGLCQRAKCEILDLEWIPDGSGLFFSRHESGHSFGGPSPGGGVIYRLDRTTWQHVEIFRLPDDAIGNLSVSPDGNTIVFERSAKINEEIDSVGMGSHLHCPCSLWMVDSDGSNLRMLTEDGRQPAWSRSAPVQPTATPQSTPIPAPPTPTPRPTAILPTPSGAIQGLDPAIWMPLVNQ